MNQGVAIGIIILFCCCIFSSIIAVLVTLYYKDPSFYGITTTPTANTNTTTTKNTTARATFSKKLITAGFDGSATNGNKLYLSWMDHGDGLYWWGYPSTSNLQTFSLDNKGYLTADDKAGALCYLNQLDKTNIMLSATLTPISFAYDASSGTLTDANGNLLGKGLNGIGSGSWPFLLTPPVKSPYVVAKVES